jgi:hypothetical protein
MFRTGANVSFTLKAHKSVALHLTVESSRNSVFLPHLLNAALKLGSKPIEMGHLNREKPSFLVGHDLVR